MDSDTFAPAQTREDEDNVREHDGVFEEHEDVYRLPYTRIAANHNDVVALAE
jgi:hypothetical protein